MIAVVSETAQGVAQAVLCALGVVMCFYILWLFKELFGGWLAGVSAIVFMTVVCLLIGGLIYLATGGAVTVSAPKTTDNGADQSFQRSVGYVRVSTAEQGISGLGLAAQRESIQRAVEYRGWELLTIYEDVSSGKSTKNRPALADALASLKRGEASALVVAKLDRLSRSVADFALILETSRAHGWALVALDLNVDTTTATGEMLANIVMSLAQWERRIIGERTRAALQELKNTGTQLGRPRSDIDPKAVEKIRTLRISGTSFRRIAAALNDTEFRSPSGRPWSEAAVRRIIAEHPMLREEW